MQFGRLTRVAKVGGVDIYVHWSVFVVLALPFLVTTRRPLSTLIIFAAYFGLLLLHEFGHVLVARLLGLDAYSIMIVPFYGAAHTQMSESRMERALVAWGGVAMQLMVAIPVGARLLLLGYTPSDTLNGVLLILSGYSLILVAINLLPIRPLDGSRAWDIIPAWLEERRIRGRKTSAAG
jgi:Zn-dependent protease